MTLHEFGQEHEEVVVLVHPSVTMWDYFEYVIPLLQPKLLASELTRIVETSQK